MIEGRAWRGYVKEIKRIADVARPMVEYKREGDREV